MGARWKYARELKKGDKIVLTVHGLRVFMEVESVEDKRRGAVNYWLVTGRRLNGDIEAVCCSAWEHVRIVRGLRD